MAEKAHDLYEQRIFLLTDAEWDEFVRRLDNPPKPNKALRDLMRRKPTWDQK